MPELPEVETIMKMVKHHLIHKTIREIRVYNPKLRWPINVNDIRNIVGLKIKKVYRRGKYIIITFSSSKLTLVIHLGMTGIISIKHAEEHVRTKHDHLLIKLDNRLFVFNDVRKFGSIHITEELESLFLINHLGIEPLSIKLNENYLYAKSRNRACTIKDFIMNQKVIVGVGNIYATESLFLSKIRPTRLAKDLTKKNYKTLSNNIKIVLKAAIKLGGTTIKDYKNAEGKPGYFTQKLLVYQKKYCPIHKRTLLSNIKLSGRSSFYCSKCQK